MKTKEFIRQVEELGYKTVKVYSFITIYDPDNKGGRVAVVSMRNERQLSISDAIYDLTKLLIDYAETPIDQREDDLSGTGGGRKMKEYNVGDTIYVKDTVTDIDGDDSTATYYGNHHGWLDNSCIIDELPAEPVKPVLPKDVADAISFAKFIGVTFDRYIVRELTRSDYKDAATYTMIQSPDVPNAIEVLLNAWNNGYTVETEKKYNVKVPKKWSGDDKYYWTKEQDGALAWVCLINKDYMMPAQQFTLTEIEHYGLQDCEKKEVTDDGE